MRSISHIHLSDDLIKSRISIAAYFFVLGFLNANFMARLPELKALLNLSNSALGSLLFIRAIGAIIGLTITGILTAKYGTKFLCRRTCLMFCILFPFIPAFPNMLIVGIIFFAIGLSASATNIAINGQAVYLERLWKKPIMSSFHAVFSLGLAIGAFTGSLYSKSNIDLAPHMISAGTFCLIILFLASFNLIADQSEVSRRLQTKQKRLLLPTKITLPLGLIAFCCMTGEGAISDWSALYMNKVVGTDIAFSGFAFGVYATGMLIGRVFGDYCNLKLGGRRLLITQGVLMILGLSLVISIAELETTLSGFFLIGLGVSNIVPIIFSRAGNMPGISPSVGIAMVTSVGYAGFFIGPPIIGFLADIYDLRIGFGFILMLSIIMFSLILQFFKKQNR